MKITQLLEYPAAVAGPLARAQARDAAGGALSNFGTVGAKRAAGQGQIPPVASTAPAAATGTTAAPAAKYNVPTGGVPSVKSNLPQPTAAPKAATTNVQVANPTIGQAPTGTAVAPTASQALNPTGDPTLNKPLPAKAPKDPNAPGIGTRIGQGVGQAAKAAGAVAGGIAGIGRALKKGYAAGADTVGGPGAASAPTPASLGGGGAGMGGGDGDDELSKLRSTLQTLDQRMRRAGL
jgi:hypothetical protein